MSNNTTNPTIRDGMIHNAMETRLADDTKIMQKVNAVYREAFVQKWPGQAEHILRLLCERIQYCLGKPDGTDLSNPSTWLATPEELRALSEALWHVHRIDQDLKSHAGS
jgi:hypothetical protein